MKYTAKNTLVLHYYACGRHRDKLPPIMLMLLGSKCSILQWSQGKTPNFHFRGNRWTPRVVLDLLTLLMKPVVSIESKCKFMSTGRQQIVTYFPILQVRNNPVKTSQLLHRVIKPMQIQKCGPHEILPSYS
jgi:hypothetical protein